MTTQGKDLKGKPQKIADESYFKECVNAAYADYGIVTGKTLSDGRSSPDQQALISTITADLDGFAISRKSFE